MAGRIEGKIIAFSESGDLITDISYEQLRYAPRDESVRIRCDEHETVGLFPAEHGQPEATFLAILPNSGSLALSIVGMSAKELLGISVGQSVTVEW